MPGVQCPSRHAECRNIFTQKSMFRFVRPSIQKKNSVIQDSEELSHRDGAKMYVVGKVNNDICVSFLHKALDIQEATQPKDLVQHAPPYLNYGMRASNENTAGLRIDQGGRQYDKLWPKADIYWPTIIRWDGYEGANTRWMRRCVYYGMDDGANRLSGIQRYMHYDTYGMDDANGSI